MHELSVAHALVSTVVAAVEGQDVVVREVHVRVGALSGVVPAALDFAYDVACAGTPLAGSLLVVVRVPAVIHCPGCEADAEVTGILVLLCPRCGAPSGDVRAGRELEVGHVVLDDVTAQVSA